MTMKLFTDRRSFLQTAAVTATTVATLTMRLEVAVLAGVMLSLVAYLYRTARPALRTMGFDSHHPQRPFVVIDPAGLGTISAAALPECPQLKLLRMEGSVWFGAVAHVADHLRALRVRATVSPEGQRHLLVMAKSMNFIDPAGAALWERERVRRRAQGGDLYFHRPRPEVLQTWQAAGFVERLGADHLFADKRSAIAHIVPLLDGAICARCALPPCSACTLSATSCCYWRRCCCWPSPRWARRAHRRSGAGSTLPARAGSPR